MKVSIWFGRDLVTGLAPVLMLVVTFVVLVFVLRRLGAARSAQEASS
jgi:hypothetical protein